MTHEETLMFVETMQKYYNNVELTHKETKQLYYDALKKYTYQEMIETFDKLLETHKYCPKISDIVSMFLANKRNQSEYIKERPKIIRCRVCLDKGFVMYRDEQNRDYACHCDKCDSGEDWKHCGKGYGDSKSPYISESVTEVLNVSEIRRENEKLTREVIGMPDYVVAELRKHGISANIIFGR